MVSLTREEKQIIVNRIKEIRKDNGITLKELGSIMEVSEAAASRYESGDVENIPLPRVKALAKKYGLFHIIRPPLIKTPKNRPIPSLNNTTEHMFSSRWSCIFFPPTPPMPTF